MRLRAHRAALFGDQPTSAPQTRTRRTTFSPTSRSCSCSPRISSLTCFFPKCATPSRAPEPGAHALCAQLEDASQGKLVLWGTLLLVVNLGTVLLAIWLQVTESNRQIVLQLVSASFGGDVPPRRVRYATTQMLLEREVRDAEMLLDSQSLRACVSRAASILGSRDTWFA